MTTKPVTVSVALPLTEMQRAAVEAIPRFQGFGGSAGAAAKTVTFLYDDGEYDEAALREALKAAGVHVERVVLA